MRSKWSRATVLAVFASLSLLGHAPAAQTGIMGRARLDVAVDQLEADPDNQELREKVIAIALGLQPRPGVPHDAQVQADKGALSVKNGDFAGAETWFKESLLIAPRVASNYSNLGVVQEKLGRPVDAAASFKLYLLAAPDASDRDAVLSRINRLSEPAAASKKHVGARARFKEMLEQLKGDYGNRELREKIIATALSLTPRPVLPDEAVEAEGAAESAFKNAKSRSEYSDAAELYEKALTVAPWVAADYFNLGVSFEKFDRLEEAEISFEWYLRAAPNASDRQEVRKRIGALKHSIERNENEQRAMTEKYGERRCAWNMDDLYRRGAMAGTMAFDADGSEVHTLSVFVQTVRAQGALVEKFTIYDITDPADIVGRPFLADWTGSLIFTFRNGGIRVHLSATPIDGGDKEIVVGPADNSSAAIRTTLNELYRERASKAAYAGYKVKLKSQDYFVSGQGGKNGCMLFFRSSIKDSLKSGAPQSLTPEFVVPVSGMSNGERKIFSDSNIGTVEGVQFHMDGASTCNVAEGPGQEY